MFIYESDRQRPAREAAGGAAASPATTWRGVAVVAGTQCCQQAQLLDGKRFLTADAPRFPLRGCRQQYCECRYRHFEDRRTRARRSEFRAALGVRPGAERRQPAERRAGENPA